MSILVATKDTLEGIFGCLVTKYIHGSSGLMRLYNVGSMKDNYALDSGTSICNIEDFLRTTKVVQRLDIMGNATDTLVSTLAENMFLYNDLQSWNKFRARHARVKPMESATESKVLFINQSMIADTTYNPALEWSDDDPLEESITNNSIESVKRGLACASLEEPAFNLKQLIIFCHEV